jgi:hypothetical protein
MIRKNYTPYCSNMNMNIHINNNWDNNNNNNCDRSDNVVLRKEYKWVIAIIMLSFIHRFTIIFSSRSA